MKNGEWCSARHLQAWCGASSFTTMMCASGWWVILHNLRHRKNARRDATMNGCTSTTATLFLCLINGSILGMPHGTWRFMLFPLPLSIRSLPRNNCWSSPRNGTCILTGNCQPMSGRSVMWILPCMVGLLGGCLRWIRKLPERVILDF